ncbi:hypothetical protein BO70DRAFT_336158 [Aspergillus heteromorphus CBS 117.55]|uniref:LysM domain-containing protein n=1 Tax=Aspergillus heteromorphus CBS 117.55 TaxID=1448321 RepID=A0A317W9I7_9EURO|nr:uncharacterized protein BO70DRAFT_336158 [Aspergillus heteromorphus CBS 117.55]PWY82993.1 hypothetical protein BO70DRAFT_336158 [Aspergillus heteromorphus CBS 117.55]
MSILPLLLAFLLALQVAAQSATPTADPTPNGPTLTGTASNCNKWYTVQKDDTCETLEKAFGLTPEQFQQWNSDVPADCSKNFWAGNAYCVGVGDASTTITTTPTHKSTTSLASGQVPSHLGSTGAQKSSTTLASGQSSYSTRNPITSYNITSTPVDDTWPPKKTQAGQPDTCNRWHLVSSGDTCDTIQRRYSSSVSKDELLEWNPSLKADCDYPSTGYWVCVGIRRPALTASYPTGDGNTSVAIPDPTPWTPWPKPTDNSTNDFPPTKTQSGLAPSCSAFYQAVPSDTCDQILAANPALTSDLLHEWNPSLKDDCSGILPDYSYCIAAYNGTNVPFPSTVSSPPYPTKQGTAGNCTGWYQKQASDTCDRIVGMFETFDKQQFVRWNPDVGVDCKALQNGYWYCISDSSTPKTRTRPVSGVTFPTAYPRQPAVTKACIKWWLVSSSDTCTTLTNINSITLSDFYTWNPDIPGPRGCQNLIPGTEVCVGVASGSGSSSSVIPGSRSYTPTPGRSSSSSSGAGPGGSVPGSESYTITGRRSSEPFTRSSITLPRTKTLPTGGSGGIPTSIPVLVPVPIPTSGAASAPVSSPGGSGLPSTSTSTRTVHIVTVTSTGTRTVTDCHIPDPAPAPTPTSTPSVSEGVSVTGGVGTSTSSMTGSLSVTLPTFRCHHTGCHHTGSSVGASASASASASARVPGPQSKSRHDTGGEDDGENVGATTKIKTRSKCRTTTATATATGGTSSSSSSSSSSSEPVFTIV